MPLHRGVIKQPLPIAHIMEYYSPMKRENYQPRVTQTTFQKSSGCRELKGHAAWDNRYDNLRREWRRGLWLPLATGILGGVCVRKSPVFILCLHGGSKCICLDKEGKFR